MAGKRTELSADVQVSPSYREKSPAVIRGGFQPADKFSSALVSIRDGYGLLAHPFQTLLPHSALEAPFNPLLYNQPLPTSISST